MRGFLPEWAALSAELYDSPALHADSRALTVDLLRAISGAVTRPEVADFTEDYTLFHFESVEAPARTDGVGTSLSSSAGRAVASGDLVASHGGMVARILRSETQPLGPEEVQEALASRIAYGTDDEAIVGWNGAVLVRQPDFGNVRSILEYANVELLKLRRLDDRLDDLLDRAYEAVARTETGRWWRRRYPLVPDREARLISRLQMESALLYEGVTNALKLVGDPYLARVYRLAARRMQLPEWDASITRKLQTMDGMYQKLSDRASTRRLEVLEWIIIVLIALSILPMFL